MFLFIITALFLNLCIWVFLPFFKNVSIDCTLICNAYKLLGLQTLQTLIGLHIYLISLTSLDKEELWFSGKCGTLFSIEVTPQPVGLKRLILRVEDAHLAMRENRNKDAIGVRVIMTCYLLQNALQLLRKQATLFKSP